MQKITPFLWFDGNAEEAMNFYVSVFEHAKVGKLARYGDSGPGPKGSVMTTELELFGQKFVLLNGGPQYKFTPAISFYIDCETQRPHLGIEDTTEGWHAKRSQDLLERLSLLAR